MDKQSSQIISLLRFPLMFMVLIVHSGSLIKGSYPFLYEIPKLLGDLIIPSYSFISGYLFFIKSPTFTIDNYKKNISRRTKTLLVPFLLWNLIPIFASIIVRIFRCLLGKQNFSDVFHYISSVDWPNLFWDHHYMDEQVYNMFGWPIKYTFTCDGPLWYMRDLIVICLFTPLIFWFIKKTRIWGLLLMSLLYLFSIYPYVTIQFKTIYYFMIGAYFAINCKPMYFQPKYNFIIILTAATLFILTLLGFNKRPFEIFGFLSCFILAKVFISYYEGSKLYITINNLGRYAFFAYALHQISIIELIKQGLLKVTSISLLAYFFAPIITFLLCSVLYIILKKYSPKVLSLLVGGRI